MYERNHSFSVCLNVHSWAKSRPLLMLVIVTFAVNAAFPLRTVADDLAPPMGGCSTPLASCRADVDPVGGNGVVDVNDLLVVINTWGQSSLDGPRPQGDCDPLPSGDCTTNVQDLLAVISEWGDCADQPEVPQLGACWLPNNTCTVNHNSQCTALGGLVWAPGANCIDLDGDRIPNAFELNTCAAVPPFFYGTDPLHWDSDRDNLPDGDEVFGTTAGLNLPLLGCDPLHKNLLLEIDWCVDSAGGQWHGHNPGPTATSWLIAAFANSPVTNPCGGPGIKLIVDRGQGPGPELLGGNQIGNNVVIEFGSGPSGFYTYKAANFAANRNGYFYYSIHCHQYNLPGSPPGNSSGFGEINGDDHMVTLLNNFDDGIHARTMMHEFGHNLTLRHGGFEDLNYKPNYNSVMNYRYQFPGIDTNCDGVGNLGLDYSHGTNDFLDEESLSEAAGICNSAPIDWNGSGIIETQPLALSINCRPHNRVACAFPRTQPNPNPNCFDNECGVLQDNNDWAQVAFTGLTDPTDFPEVIFCDPPQDAPRDD